MVFADLVGSTELAGSQDPERIRALLNRFYDAMAAEIERAGGTVEKFAGDAVMAAFGAPRAHEDHAERALHAALSMQHRLKELFGEALVLRIGVNTGEVVAGRAREGGSFVTGDAVNVAARLEQAAASGEILAGERTVTAVRGAFEFAEPMVVEAKGKPAGIACRRLLRALSLMRPRGVSGLRRAFVGRDAELACMESAYRGVVERVSPHVVTISGEAGVGKTRLVREFWEHLGSEIPEPLRRTGRCLAYGQGITYWPLGEILKEEFGILESDPPETVAERLGERAILGLTLGLDIAGDVHPLAARDRLHTGWVRFVEELVAERPAVMLIEDIHWAEAPLLDLLERLVEDVRGPLLLVATARPELYDVRPGWGGARRDASTVELEALPAEAAVLMLDELLAGELPAHMTETIVRKAEGNPFFLEELIESLIDQGALCRSNGGWTVSEQQAGIAVPDSVQAVLASRIDLLPAAEKAALQAASVIGRVFWTLPVYELVAGLDPDLRVLEARDFVRRRAGSSIAGETEYAFKHQLTREVAYEGLPKGKRARLHASFATWLEGFGGGRAEHAPLLAHHYAEAVKAEDADLAWAGAEVELAGLRAAAVIWLRRAAELAVGRYDMDDALELLHQAVELGPPEIHVDLWRRIAEASALKYDGEGFWKAMQNAIAFAGDRTTRSELYSVLAYETTVRLGMWRTRPDQTMVKRWVDEALELSEDGSPERVRALAALAAWDSTGGLEIAREAVTLAERLGSNDLIAAARLQLVESALASGSTDEALEEAQTNLALLGSTPNPDDREGIYWAATLANLGCGRFEEARFQTGFLSEAARELSSHHRIHAIGLRLMVEELAGRWETVRALTRDAEAAVTDNLATPCNLNARSLLVCALANAHAGDDEEARRLETSADDLQMEGYGLTIEAPRLRLSLLRNDLEEAERLLRSGEAMYFAWTAATAARLDALIALGWREPVEEEAEPLLRPNTYLEPFALRALGCLREDAVLIVQALERFESMGLDWHAAETRALM
ncbi:MAG TPA: adenylate/guanylate cyclase domain-containing protein [Gaiellaceae bacterium]|nr:adenylate/guanylate cyclase domain-containing protein [Gaiellaceae bacterium]